MNLTRVHPRIIQHPFAQLIHGARLDSCQITEKVIVLNIQGLERISSQVFERDGKLYEKADCYYIPLRLCFSKVTELKYSRFFTELEKYPLEDSSRIIMGMYSWLRPDNQDIFYILFLHPPLDADMMFFAKSVTYEISDQKSPVTIERDWSPAPPMPERLVPRPNYLHKQFGGDPITIHVNGKVRHHKFFIGGLDIQPQSRPQVDAVLNLTQEASRWVREQTLHPHDRSITKGEGSDGMSVSEIRAEAEWVLERLKQNQSVLVHCAAGMNRSTTICCATLMLLEGLSAEAALERIREHHPWARPDSHHWLALRWLETTNKG